MNGKTRPGSAFGTEAGNRAGIATRRRLPQTPEARAAVRASAR